MKLRKMFTVGAGATAVALALTACGGGTDDAATDTGTSTNGDSIGSEPVTLTVWESANESTDFIRQAGEAFTELYPNITINPVSVEIGDAATQIALDGPAGVGPDVFTAPHDTLGNLLEQGMILPVSNPDTVKANALEFATNALTSNDTLYGYPVAAETFAMYYNRELVDEVPTTFEELIEFATDFNAANPGKFGFVMDVGNFYYTFPFMTMDGNRLFGETGTNADEPEVNSEASVAGFGYLQQLREILPVAAGDLTTDAVDGLFGAGTAAIHISGPWNVEAFANQGIDYGVAPLFSLPGQDTPAISFSGVRTTFVSAFSEHPDEAHAFAEFLTTPEMQQLRTDVTGSMSISTSEITYDNDAITGFAAQLEHSFAMPSIPRMAAVWDALNAASANIWNGADPQAELDAATQVILAD
ncbi:extracellular solute-binding protein family 1 [Xylanimonas cellulosilytica DSM 15894]|uniref:Maltodextrin-binding protein n=1 Tax=Xylanimonas cellulosilytica (strain DSM 15894 / JCM 12276 / CECT 5975 / KCTC 9989 / LMG 20990 / NBRC 107835 / XIL07) TaxID=446471 RepID=D1BUF7_XYLCX|nr:maltose ABC transporter substrate-binding protein [Xylanimonas cellulosilytica]ACZ31170.1 extracellular solute-binding protein family 1 [Xylanimonas cellulosilytica DSM 15894]